MSNQDLGVVFFVIVLVALCYWPLERQIRGLQSWASELQGRIKTIEEQQAQIGSLRSDIFRLERRLKSLEQPIEPGERSPVEPDPTFRPKHPTHSTILSRLNENKRKG